MTQKPNPLSSIKISGPIPAHLARAVIEETLRNAILDGRLPCGTAMRQQELASLFGVSRMPVREALRQLEAQSLLHVVTHKGAVALGLFYFLPQHDVVMVTGVEVKRMDYNGLISARHSAFGLLLLAAMAAMAAMAAHASAQAQPDIANGGHAQRPATVLLAQNTLTPNVAIQSCSPTSSRAA